MPAPTSPRPTRPARRALPVAATLALALGACDSDPVAPIESARMSAAAEDYLDFALDFEQEASYHTREVNWTTARRQVRERASGAQRVQDTHAAIEYSITNVLRPVGDRHSGFWPREEAPGLVDSPPDALGRYLVSGQPLANTGTARIAYLWMPTFSGINDVGRADSTQQVIRTLDAEPPCGWVLDLRFNPGGSWAAMLSGLNPLLGDAPASTTTPGFGGFVDADGYRYNFFVDRGASGVYDPSARRAYTYVRATSAYTLRRPNSPVAILTGGTTASAGEMITLAFRGSTVPHRTFGAATYGVTTVPVGEYLQPDSSYLNITYAVMFDRTGRQYGAEIAPDVPVTGPAVNTLRPQPAASDPVVAAASQWLRSRPECGGTGAVTRGPAFGRAPTTADLPGAVAPAARPLPPVSRWFVQPRG